ncbi:RecB family exonuclease [Sinomonas mesophila]|uniref:RecB family exonuclease n=1 Tax=Sinomonas mesophila TaxID=1531955 RepID=UPI0015897F76|nr:PD-(D/E)XK nuclease family protein [Sinomonas mesophila]
MGETMIVEFGWFLDRAPWAYSRPGLNRVRVGRKNFIGLLQTRLGLTRPDTPNAGRVSQYLRRLERLDTPDAWFHGSLQADPWSTAQELLAARDDAVANGWDGSLREPVQGTDDAGPSPLLRTLAAAERAPGELAPSLADDVVELLAELGSSPLPLGIDELVLQHPEATFPEIWRRIIGALRARGVRVSETPRPAQSPEITVLTAGTEWEAAEHAARWLAAGTNNRTAVVCSEPTSVLDQYLTLHGQPRLGVGDRSPWRAQDQLIPLFFELVWAPANVHLLAEFLTLPDSPVRRAAGRHLLHALAQEPGVHGAAWAEAIAAISSDPSLGPGPADALDRTFRTRLLKEEERPSGTQLIEATAWLASTLSARAAVTERLQPTLAQLKRVLELLAPLPHVSRRDLRRIIASVLTPHSEPVLPAEAAPWLRLNHLVELGEDVEDALWWGFPSASTPSARRWDAHDADSLAKVGVHLPTPKELTALSVRETLAAAGRCKRLIVVQTAQRNGERVDANPLLEALVAAHDHPDGVSTTLAERIAQATRAPSSLNKYGMWRLAGRETRLTRAAAVLPVPPEPALEVGANPALAPERLSFSQLEVLLGCSLRWALERKGRLTVPDAADIPEGSRMIGTFAHRVIERLHEGLRAEHRAVPTDAEISAAIDGLLPAAASELLLPGQKARRLTVVAAITEAARVFFSRLQSGGVALQEMEKPILRELQLVTQDGVLAIPVSGSADAVGIDSEGHTVVVDLKWSSGGGHLREKVRKGTALQLALYQWAIGEGEAPADHPTAYYLLKQHDFSSAHPHFGPRTPRAWGPDELWQRAVRSAEHIVAQVLAGRVTAAKPYADALEEQGGDGPATFEEIETAVGRLYVEPGCRFCRFGALCGLKGDYS